MQEAFLKDGLRLAESSVRAALASVASGAWLAVRLHMLVAAVVTVIAVVAVLQHSKFIPESSHEAQEEASLLGLSLVYALTLTGTLRTTLTSSAEVESDLLAAGRAQRLVERMSGTAEAGARLGLEHQASALRGRLLA